MDWDSEPVIPDLTYNSFISVHFQYSKYNHFNFI